MKQIIETDGGVLMIYAREAAITEIWFGWPFPLHDGLASSREMEDAALIERAAEELREYFRGERKVFTLPLAPCGTKFQKAVWRELEKIPFGETRAYSDIARAVGSPKAMRAVGAACRQNPIPIVIPCHRVVGKDGSLTGFASGLEMKRRLLQLEGVEFLSDHIQQ